MRRSAALAGVVGPVAFVATWVRLGATTAGYSAVHRPISRLTAVDTSTRWGMTGGILVLGASLGAFATGLRGDHPGAARAAAISAAATVGVAATPLGSALGGNAHAAVVGLTYTSLAAIPALMARDLGRAGRSTAARAGLVTAVACAGALALSILDHDRTGLWQRSGLTLGHAWIVATAARGLRRPVPVPA